MSRPKPTEGTPRSLRDARSRSKVAAALAPPVACLLLVACATPSTNGARPGGVVTESVVTGPGERALRQTIVVPGTPRDVWRAWTTTEGFSAWAAPVAHVDFRLGGIIEASYDPKRTIGTPGNIRNEIVAYVPERMLAIRNVQAPPNLPFDVAVFQSLHTVVLIEPLEDGATRVSAWQPGYRDGPAYDTVWSFFSRGNAATLLALRDYLSRQPAAGRPVARDAPAAR